MQVGGSKNPLPVAREWVGIKDSNEAGLLAATEDQGKSTETEKGGGGWLWDDHPEPNVVDLE